MSGEKTFLTEQSTKLSQYVKLSYFSAGFTFIFMVTLVNTFSLIFLTNVALFPTAIAGSILFVGRILDASTTAPIGMLLDRSNLRWGKYRPWLVIGSIFTLIFNVLFFMDWDGSTGSVLAKAVLCCLVYTAFCAFASLTHTSYASLNSSLTFDLSERVNLSSLRGQGSSLGRIAAGFLLIPMIHFFGGASDFTARGMIVVAFITGMVLVFGFCNLAIAVKSRDTFQPRDPAQPKAKSLTAAEAFRFVTTNRPLLCLIGADFFRLLAFLVTLAMFPFFFLYVAQDPGAAPLLFGTTAIASFVGATLIRYITKRISKRNTYLIGMIIFGASFFVANIFKHETYIMVGVLVVGFVGYAFGFSANTAMYADLVDYGEVKYGKNSRTNYFAMNQLSIELAALFSTGISGFGLAAIGFVAGTEPTEQVIRGINFICLALPIGLSVFSIICLLLYNLSEHKMAEVRETLAEQRAKFPT